MYCIAEIIILQPNERAIISPPPRSLQDVSFTKVILYMCEYFAKGSISEKEHVWDVVLDLVGLFLGLVLFAILVGFMTEVVEKKMEGISEGMCLSYVCVSIHVYIYALPRRCRWHRCRHPAAGINACKGPIYS